MSKRLLSAEHQSYHGVGIAVYFIYIYIFVTVVIEECDGPRAFVLRWGGAEEANQRDHGHLAGAEVLLSPAARSHTAAPVSLQSGCRRTNSAILSPRPPISAFTTINVPWFCKLVYVSLSFRCGLRASHNKE